MGSIIGHSIEYNGVGVLRGQRHIPSKSWPKYPSPHPLPPPQRNCMTSKLPTSSWWRLYCFTTPSLFDIPVQGQTNVHTYHLKVYKKATQPSTHNLILLYVRKASISCQFFNNLNKWAAHQLEFVTTVCKLHSLMCFVYLQDFFTEQSIMHSLVLKVTGSDDITCTHSNINTWNKLICYNCWLSWGLYGFKKCSHDEISSFYWLLKLLLLKNCWELPHVHELTSSVKMFEKQTCFNFISDQLWFCLVLSTKNNWNSSNKQLSWGLNLSLHHLWAGTLSHLSTVVFWHAIRGLKRTHALLEKMRVIQVLCSVNWSSRRLAS